MATSSTPIPLATLQAIAQRGVYSIDVNPRQLLINNIGYDGFYGGGNVRQGSSAAELDDLLVLLASYVWPQPHSTLAGPQIQLDTSDNDSTRWVNATVADVQNLRAAFFSLYGLGKPRVYGDPLKTPAA